jgi:beta-phosphoglucomutase-like phosphatase (HAD superfamily)
MPTKLDAEIVAAAIAGFEEQKRRIDARIAELRNMQGLAAAEGAGRAPTGRRRMSAAARARIAAAQRKRWAEARKQAGATSSTPPVRKKRTLSAAGRKAIIEATKRRWAAFRKPKPRPFLRAAGDLSGDPDVKAR